MTTSGYRKRHKRQFSTFESLHNIGNHAHDCTDNQKRAGHSMPKHGRIKHIRTNTSIGRLTPHIHGTENICGDKGNRRQNTCHNDGRHGSQRIVNQHTHNSYYGKYKRQHSHTLVSPFAYFGKFSHLGESSKLYTAIMANLYTTSEYNVKYTALRRQRRCCRGKRGFDGKICEFLCFFIQKVTIFKKLCYNLINNGTERL